MLLRNRLLLNRLLLSRLLSRSRLLDRNLLLLSRLLWGNRTIHRLLWSLLWSLRRRRNNHWRGWRSGRNRRFCSLILRCLICLCSTRTKLQTLNVIISLCFVCNLHNQQHNTHLYKFCFLLLYLCFHHIIFLLNLLITLIYSINIYTSNCLDLS